MQSYIFFTTDKLHVYVRPIAEVVCGVCVTSRQTDLWSKITQLHSWDGDEAHQKNLQVSCSI